MHIHLGKTEAFIWSMYPDSRHRVRKEKRKQCTSSAKMNGSILESDSRGLKLDVSIRVDMKLAHDIIEYSMGSRVRLAKDVYYLGIE